MAVRAADAELEYLLESGYGDGIAGNHTGRFGLRRSAVALAADFHAGEPNAERVFQVEDAPGSEDVRGSLLRRLIDAMSAAILVP